MWSPSLLALVLFLSVFAAEGFLRTVCRPNSTTLDLEALPGLFGPLLPTEGLTGFLVEARPVDLCPPIGGPPSSSFVFLAFLYWYKLCFTMKICHAQQAGSQTAVVHNVNSPNLVSLRSETDVHLHDPIPAKAASKILRRLRQAGKLTLKPRYFHSACKRFLGTARISSSSPCRCRAQLPGPCLLQMILLYTCWVICSLGLALTSSLLLEKCLSRGPSSRSRRRQLLPENWQSRASIVFSPSKYQECAICLEKHTRGDILKVLSCSHAFHRRCINIWHNTQVGSKTCPLCKQKVTVVSLLYATRFCRDRQGEISWTAIPLKSRPTAEGHRPHRRRHHPSQF
ncbi:E3 ubiquitin-protein ligase ZNRF4-like [Pogona vitticeps]